MLLRLRAQLLDAAITFTLLPKLPHPQQMATNPDWRPETLALHAGYEEADAATKSRAVPIYQVRSSSLSSPGSLLTCFNRPSRFSTPCPPSLTPRFQTTSFVFNNSEHAANLFGVSASYLLAFPTLLTSALPAVERCVRSSSAACDDSAHKLEPS